MSHIRQLRISGVEKRSKPSKHYAYIIRLVWTDGKRTTAVRDHNAFFSFHCELLELFPDEAGENGHPRIIPSLPGQLNISAKIDTSTIVLPTIGKSAFSKTEEKALRFSGPVQDYCINLLCLPQKISRSDHVLKFFRPTQADYAFEDLERTLGSQVGDSKRPWWEEDADIEDLPNDSNKISTAVSAAEYIAEVQAKSNSIDGNEVDPSRANHLLVKDRLPYRKGERLFVVRMTGCPGGHWWCRNSIGDEGHVPSADLEIDAANMESHLRRLTMSANDCSNTVSNASEKKISYI
eukprot:gene9772-1972_t